MDMQIIITGRGGVGKTTLAKKIEAILIKEGKTVLRTDGEDNPRGYLVDCTADVVINTSNLWYQPVGSGKHTGGVERFKEVVSGKKTAAARSIFDGIKFRGVEHSDGTWSIQQNITGRDDDWMPASSRFPTRFISEEVARQAVTSYIDGTSIRRTVEFGQVG